MSDHGANDGDLPLSAEELQQASLHLAAAVNDIINSIDAAVRVEEAASRGMTLSPHMVRSALRRAQQQLAAALKVLVKKVPKDGG